MKFANYDPAFPGLGWQRTKTWLHKIYLLVDPRDNTVRYVGLSTDPLKRLENHKSPGSHNWGMAEWKLELRKLGMRPLMAVVDSAPEGEHLHREDAWMFYFVNNGFWLLNSRPNRHYRAGHRSRATRPAPAREWRPKRRKRYSPRTMLIIDLRRKRGISPESIAGEIGSHPDRVREAIRMLERFER